MTQNMQVPKITAYSSIFYPLRINFFILGFLPWKSPFLSNLLGVILVITNVVLTILYFKSVNEMDIDFAKADTIKFLSIVRDLGSTSVMVCSLTYFYMSLTKLTSKIYKVSQVDQKLNFELRISESNKKVKYQIIAVLLIENFIFNTLGEIASAMVRDNDRILYLMVNMYPRLVVGLVNCIFYSILMLVQTRFEIINELVREKVEKSQIVTKYPNELDFCDYVFDLVSLHKILVKVVNDINQVFSFHVLICITINFVLLIGDLHTSMYIIFFDLFYKHNPVILDMMKNCVSYTFELFYLAKRSSDLCNEANRTKNLLLGIRIDIDKEDERNTIIASVLKLMQNKLEITACKLFKINNALLFSICGAASSYLFIMLQLDIGNQEGAHMITQNISNLH